MNSLYFDSNPIGSAKNSLPNKLFYQGCQNWLPFSEKAIPVDACPASRNEELPCIGDSPIPPNLAIKGMTASDVAKPDASISQKSKSAISSEPVAIDIGIDVG